MATADFKPTPRRFRFSIRVLLLLVTLSVALIVVGQRYIEFRYSRPIAEVVDEINAQITGQYSSSVSASRPLLTVARVVDFLKSDNEQVTDAPLRFTTMFQRIANKNRVPNEAKFDVVPVVSDGTFSDGWSIRMKIENGTLSHTIIIDY